MTMHDIKEGNIVYVKDDNEYEYIALWINGGQACPHLYKGAPEDDFSYFNSGDFKGAFKESSDIYQHATQSQIDRLMSYLDTKLLEIYKPLKEPDRRHDI
jgi:hypothetical protein